MTVETATFISDLNPLNPGSTDLKSEGDDHLRLVKAAVKATFPNVTGAVTASHTSINQVVGALYANNSGAVGINTGPSILANLHIRQDSGDGPVLLLENRVVSATIHKHGAVVFSPYRDVADPVYGAAVWSEGASPAGYASTLCFGVSQNSPPSVFPTIVMRLSPAGALNVPGAVTAPNFNGYLATGNISQFVNDVGFVISGGGAAVAWTSITGRPTALSAFTNDTGFITGVTVGAVTGALGYTPYNATNPAGYISGVTIGAVTGALGFTPYNATNPAGYITGAGNAATATNVAWGGVTGKPINTITMTTTTGTPAAAGVFGDEVFVY